MNNKEKQPERSTSYAVKENAVVEHEHDVKDHLSAILIPVIYRTVYDRKFLLDL